MANEKSKSSRKFGVRMIEPRTSQQNSEPELVKAYKKYAIAKADQSTQIDLDSNRAASEWIEPPLPMFGFKVMVDNSTILPQCIRAYKQNICGFGINVKYKETSSTCSRLTRTPRKCSRTLLSSARPSGLATRKSYVTMPDM